MLINHDFPAEFSSLTERQIQVLGCLGDHMTTKEIARALDISPSMVDQHLRAISNKLGGLPRRELARMHAEYVLRARPVPAPRLTALPDLKSPDLKSPDRDLSMAQASASPESVWHSSFVAGFVAGLVFGILVALSTIVCVTLLLGAR